MNFRDEITIIKLAQAGTLSNGALYLAQGYLGIALKVSWPLSCYQPTFLMVSGHEEGRGKNISNLIMKEEAPEFHIINVSSGFSRNLLKL